MSAGMFKQLPVCGGDTAEGTVARCLISKLKPTQNAVGRDEVDAKAVKFGQRSQDALEAYLLARRVPVVIGSSGDAHLIDHHHLAAAVLQGVGDIELPVLVVRNWSPMNTKHFWKEMLKAHWMYPFGTNGGGPIPYTSMCGSISELGNDIFREFGLGGAN